MEYPRQRAICDASGFKCYADELVRQWDGMMVLPQFCDRRNPQDFVKGVPDNQTVRVSRPEAVDAFISTTVRPEDL